MKSGTALTTRDIFTDFTLALDKLGLSGIDANTNTTTAGVDTFSALLNSISAFMTAGQLKLIGSVLYGNTNL